MGPYPQYKSSGAGRDLIVTLCLITLILFFGWVAFSNIRQNQIPPVVRDASAALKKKDVAKARALFDAELKAQPDNPLLYRQIGAVSYQFKQYALGVEYLRRSLQACKDQPKSVRAELYHTLATLLAEADPAPPQSEAIDAAERALELAPEDPGMLNLLGYLLADNNLELDRAQDLITKALKLAEDQKNESPSGPALVSAIEDSYGWVLYRKGNYAGAIDALTHAIADIPEGGLTGDDLKVYYYHLGAACRKAGRQEEALRAIKTALQYDPDYAPAKAEQAVLTGGTAPRAPQKAPSSPRDKNAPPPSLTVPTPDDAT
ncbi:MAG TPA: tetratricopeptide repeat protein [Chthonomonadaceae bacterium]|nr:tetratricopeptide repeat protein [Chthonomonadaceae bacterium]